MDSSRNIIILGDLNEDFLNENYRNLHDIVMTNSLQNVINAPNKRRALLDPILVPDDLSVYDSGDLSIPNEITDHSATYILLPHNYSVSYSQGMVL